MNIEKNQTDAAGASTRPRHPMEYLLKIRPDAVGPLKPGDIVEGTVIEKRGSRLYVDLGARGTGIVYGREYYAAQDILKNLEPGATVTAKVADLDNDEGYIELSLKEAGREKNWQEMNRLMEIGELIPLKVLEANRGGLILEYLGVQGFLPASQLSQEHYPRVEGGDKERIFDELKKLVSQTLSVSIIDINPEEGKLIFSEKAKETEATRKKLESFSVGDVVEGEIAGIVTFGAFVKFGEGLEGLVHISEIDWQLIGHPGDVLKIGDHVKAKIIGIEGDKVSLSLKALKEDPWSHVEERYQKGQVVRGTVTKFNPFGAFVKLDEEIQGLAHISEFGTEAKMRETLKLGESFELEILSIEPKDHRLALGIPGRVREVPAEPAAEATTVATELEPK